MTTEAYATEVKPLIQAAWENRDLLEQEEYSNAVKADRKTGFG